MSSVFLFSILATIFSAGLAAWLFFGNFDSESIKNSVTLTVSEAALALLSILGVPIIVAMTTYDESLQEYPTEFGWFVPIAAIAGFSGWRLVKYIWESRQSKAR
jgi:hypothetical protein